MPVKPASEALLVAISDRGRRCGQTHPKAKLTDAQVDEIRELHEGEGLGYKRLAERFQVPRDTVRDICTYVSRVATVAGAKRINLIRLTTTMDRGKA